MYQSTTKVCIIFMIVIIYCRVVLVDENEEGIVMETDEGVIYYDEYVKQDGKWLISKRNSNFIYQDVKPLSNGQ